MTLDEQQQLKAVKTLSRMLALTPAAQRTAALRAMADRLLGGTEQVLRANRGDLAAAAGCLDDRRIGILTIDAKSIQDMASTLQRAADLDDPVGRLLESADRSDGLHREKRLFPLGVVAMVYEARPNVVADGAALCVRTGNALVLRCSRHSVCTDTAITNLLRQGLTDAGLPEDVLVMLSRADHQLTHELSLQNRLIDLLIVRSGSTALDALRRTATVPVLGAGPGNCHIYIDASAQPDMAQAIVYNSKVPRPLACNAAETLLVERNWARAHLALLAQKLIQAGIELRGCPDACALCPEMKPAVDSDWEQEFFAPVLAVKLVDGVAEAINHINCYRTPHTESIITEDAGNASRFMAEVEANVVCHNASTRLTDGIEFGLGGEMGISTQKYPCGGPIGILSLMQQKYYLSGSGALR